MNSIENSIRNSVKKSIGDSIKYEITEIVMRENTYFVMIEVTDKVNDLIEKSLESDIYNSVGKKAKICFIQNASKPVQSRKIVREKRSIEGVKKVIMICSGKGGVGKSTISSAIAYFLHSAGCKVGLFDADIYGPSIPKIFHLNDEIKIESGKFIPHDKYGIKLMSMGFVVQSNDALVWRGPMVSKTLHNMLMHTTWSKKSLMKKKSDLDYLILDTPPGTGDVHLSLAENYVIDGAIVVSTPQDLAISNAHRSVSMLKKLGIKILGVVENMAYIENSDGSKNYLFGENNVHRYAISQGLQLLAQIPVISDISTGISLDKINLSQSFSQLCGVLKNII